MNDRYESAARKDGTFVATCGHAHSEFREADICAVKRGVSLVVMNPGGDVKIRRSPSVLEQRRLHPVRK